MLLSLVLSLPVIDISKTFLAVKAGRFSLKCHRPAEKQRVTRKRKIGKKSYAELNKPFRNTQLKESNC